MGACPEIAPRKDVEAPFLPYFFAPEDVRATRQRVRGGLLWSCSAATLRRDRIWMEKSARANPYKLAPLEDLSLCWVRKVGGGADFLGAFLLALPIFSHLLHENAQKPYQYRAPDFQANLSGAKKQGSEVRRSRSQASSCETTTARSGLKVRKGGDGSLKTRTLTPKSTLKRPISTAWDPYKHAPETKSGSLIPKKTHLDPYLFARDPHIHSPGPPTSRTLAPGFLTLDPHFFTPVSTSNPNALFLLKFFFIP